MGRWHNGPWSFSTEARLAGLWKGGTKVSDIAAEISKLIGRHVGTDAVIGKAHRMKLGKHPIRYPQYADRASDLRPKDGG